VSTPELDALVECARAIGERGGVLGARMNGAGFGGCTVTLVHAAQAAAVCDELQREYEHRTGRVLDVFVSRPARGARVLDATSLG
jgi:galactokinase